MKVILPGIMGRMGKVLCEAVSQHEALSLAGGTVRPGSTFAGQDAGALVLGQACDAPIVEQLDQIESADCGLIDFTTLELLPQNLAWCVENRVPMVIGTTGLDEALKAQILEASKQIPIVFAPNMSVGVNVMQRLIRLAAEWVGDHSDIEVIEAHQLSFHSFQ